MAVTKAARRRGRGIPRKRSGKQLDSFSSSDGRSSGSSGSSDDESSGDRQQTGTSHSGGSLGWTSFSPGIALRSLRADMAFELFVVIFLLSHLVVQNFNVYRTNSYNYNVALLSFTAIYFLHGLVITYFLHLRKASLQANAQVSWAQQVPFVAATIGALSAGMYLMLQLFLHHSLRTVLYIFYPIVVYASLVYPAARTDGSGTVALYAQPLKLVVYKAFEGAYFCGFLPLKFVPDEYVYYDPLRCAAVALFLFLAGLVLFSCRLLATNYAVFFSACRTLGSWRAFPDTPGHLLKRPPTAWDRERSYPEGEIVLHGGKHYQAIAAVNTVEPGQWLPRLFYLLFSDPERMHTLLLGLQALVMGAQLLLVLSSAAWNLYLLLLFLNYYIFFFCLKTRRRSLAAAADVADRESIEEAKRASLAAHRRDSETRDRGGGVL